MQPNPCLQERLGHLFITGILHATVVEVRIFEVFTSVEGEGILCGAKTLFVRLAGCPFACFYCDTPEALPADSGTRYSLEDATALIDDRLQKNTFKVNFTGGDPLMQHEAVAEMARHVQSLGVATYLESSCFDHRRFAHILPHLDYAKIEFKTPDSEFVGLDLSDAAHHSAMKCLHEAVRAGATTYVKVVVSKRTPPQYVGALASEVFGSVPVGSVSGFVIQPTYGTEEPSLDRLMTMYDTVYPIYDGVRIIPQMHKIIGAP